jgi:hypothetical protein
MVQRVIILKLLLEEPVPLAALRRRFWPLGYWDRGFESRSSHGCLCFCVVLSCVGRGLVTGWSFVEGVQQNVIETWSSEKKSNSEFEQAIRPIKWSWRRSVICPLKLNRGWFVFYLNYSAIFLLFLVRLHSVSYSLCSQYFFPIPPIVLKNKDRANACNYKPVY